MRLHPAIRTLVGTGPAGAVLVSASMAALIAAATGFLDPVSLLITVGGTLAVTRVTFSRARLAGASHRLHEALTDEGDAGTVIGSLKRLARIHRVEGAIALERAAAEEPDPFLRSAVALAAEIRDSGELEHVLAGEARLRASEGEAARQVMITLGKLFPAFGLIGTLIGLVLLMRNLAGADLDSIAPGLGIAVLTTLYGAVLSNVVVLPLATKLQVHLARRALMMQMIIEGTLMLQRREYPSRIERALRAYIGMPLGELRRTPPSAAPVEPEEQTGVVHLTERAA